MIYVEDTFEVELSRIIRAAEEAITAKLAKTQLGEAWRDLDCER